MKALQDLLDPSECAADDSRTKMPVSRGTVIGLVDCADSGRVLAEAKRIADGLGQKLTALHVETPETALSREPLEALKAASRLGAEAVSIPASTAVDGIVSQAAHASYLVLQPAARLGTLSKRSLLQQLSAELPETILVCVPGGVGTPRPTLSAGPAPGAGAPLPYLIGIAAVAATVAAVLLLRPLIGGQALAVLFLLPVLAIAARFGFRPGMFASIVAALSYNFFVLKPAYAFHLGAPQDALMLGSLLVLAAYTSFVTGRLRKRAILSDRSAQENAALAALALELTKAADWEGTAQVLSRDVGAILKVEAAVLREVGGRLVVAAANGEPPVFDPIDQAALDWTWNNGEEAGSGTEILPAGNWQFHPLKTSLGRLAVLALARHDGRNPLPAEKRLLFATILAQASLAHERLRLEDEVRC